MRLTLAAARVSANCSATVFIVLRDLRQADSAEVRTWRGCPEPTGREDAPGRGEQGLPPAPRLRRQPRSGAAASPSGLPGWHSVRASLSSPSGTAHRQPSSDRGKSALRRELRRDPRCCGRLRGPRTGLGSTQTRRTPPRRALSRSGAGGGRGGLASAVAHARAISFRLGGPIFHSASGVRRRREGKLTVCLLYVCCEIKISSLIVDNTGRPRPG